MFNYTEPKLSPSQQAVLHAIEKNPLRYLPKGAVIDIKDEFLKEVLHLVGCRWEWSWTILQEAHTADYRRRIHEINKIPGYNIISFRVYDAAYSRTRHGYILIPPSQKEEELSL